MPRLRIPADSALLKFSLRTILLNHSTHRPLMAPLLSHYHKLLHFLHDQLSEYFLCPRSCVGSKLFSHLLSSVLLTTSTLAIVSTPTSLAVTFPPSQDCHSVLYVPVGPEGVWNGPLDWAPLFVYLLVTSLFPDLPCLVCTPGHQLRSFAALPCSLHSLCSTLFFAPAVLVSISPPRNLLLEETFFSICLTLPLLLILINLPLHFVLFPLMRLSRLFAPLVKTHQQSCYTWRGDLLDSCTIAADQHFPFYCTPYYGFSPPSLPRHAHNDP